MKFRVYFYVSIFLFINFDVFIFIYLSTSVTWNTAACSALWAATRLRRTWTVVRTDGRRWTRWRLTGRRSSRPFTCCIMPGRSTCITTTINPTFAVWPRWLKHYMLLTRCRMFYSWCTMDCSGISDYHRFIVRDLVNCVDETCHPNCIKTCRYAGRHIFLLLTK